MLKWAVIGCRGQLGSAFTDSLSEKEIVAAVSRPELDITDPLSIKKLFEDFVETPDVLVNAAAMTHVDHCERAPDHAHFVNAEGPEMLASECNDRGIRLVHVSTDYVFSGNGTSPYREDEATSPKSEYGRSKLEGERRVFLRCPSALVVRTSWVFGRGRNFIAAILAQAEARRRQGDPTPLRVVDDQRGRPTYAADLAAAIHALVEAGARGLYHVANRGEATWWDLARATLDLTGFQDLSIERICAQDLNLPAPRPTYSVLDCSKAEALGIDLRDWQDALRAYLYSVDSPIHLKEQNTCG